MGMTTFERIDFLPLPIQVEIKARKQLPKKAKDRKFNLSPDVVDGRNVGKSKANAFKSPGLQKKDKKASYDGREQRVR